MITIKDNQISRSIGAMKVKNECNQFKEFCLAGNAEGYNNFYIHVRVEKINIQHLSINIHCSLLYIIII